MTNRNSNKIQYHLTLKRVMHISVKMKYIQSLIVLLIPVIFNSCATITKDDSQPVSFSSEPQGADVSLNSISVGTTPTTVMVKRKMGKTMVTYSKEGYRTQTFPLDKSVAGMTFGNIIFGGLIGVGVDVATGKATNYQDSVHVKLIPEGDTSSTPSPTSTNTGKPTAVQSKSTRETLPKEQKEEARKRLLRLYTKGEISEAEYKEMMLELGE